jgi:hypothetical protein
MDLSLKPIATVWMSAVTFAEEKRQAECHIRINDSIVEESLSPTHLGVLALNNRYELKFCVEESDSPKYWEYLGFPFDKGWIVDAFPCLSLEGKKRAALVNYWIKSLGTPRLSSDKEEGIIKVKAKIETNTADYYEVLIPGSRKRLAKTIAKYEGQDLLFDLALARKILHQACF